MCGVVWGWGYVAVSDKHAWHFIIPSLSHTHSLSLTPHLFAFLIFSSSSFLFLLNILSLSTFLLSFLLLLQSPLSSSHFPPPSFSFRFLQPLKPSNSAHLIGSVPPIHSDSFTFFKLFFFWISRFRISQLEVVFFFFLLFFCYDKIDWCCISASSFSRYEAPPICFRYFGFQWQFFVFNFYCFLLCSNFDLFLIGLKCDWTWISRIYFLNRILRFSFFLVFRMPKNLYACLLPASVCVYLFNYYYYYFSNS